MQPKKTVVVLGAPAEAHKKMKLLFVNCDVEFMDELTSTPCHAVLLYGGARPDRWERVGVQLLHLNPTPQQGGMLHIFTLSDGKWQRACVFPSNKIWSQHQINWTTEELALSYRGRVIRRPKPKTGPTPYDKLLAETMASRQV